MKLLSTILFGAFACAALQGTFASSFEEEDNVIVLTDDNFDDALETFDALLVEFYAPWCGHCKQLAPEYAKAAKQLKKDGFSIAKLDATAHRKAAEKFSISGFPTLKFFQGADSVSDYDGDRTAAGIANWVRRRSGPPAETVENVEELEAITADADVVVVGIFEDLESKGAKAFEKVAATKNDVRFAITKSDEVRSNLEAGSGSQVVAVKNFETERANRVFEGSVSDKTALGNWIDLHSLPVVIPFTSELSGRIFKGHISTHFLFFIDQDADDSEEMLSVYRKVAEKHEGEALFITVPPSEGRILSFFEIEESDLPTAVLVSMPKDGQMKKYRFPKEDGFVESTFNKFLSEYESGKLKPFLKSAPIPEEGEDYDGNVKVIVGKTFGDVALDESKNVLVEFYAPWCGHCQKLAPEYEKAAEELSDDDSVVLAKVDATANEVDYEGVVVQGFPTLYFFPAGKKTPVPYDGDRDSAGIVKFVQKHSKVPENDKNEL